MSERLIFERVTQEELDMPAYGLEFTGPSHWSISFGTGSEERCRTEAPDIARTIKRRENQRWVAWKIELRPRRSR